jgi:zinc D-Ala-D-Ala carboxypeptidase
MSKWVHFTDEEAKGLVDDLMFKLERARTLFDAPLIITSGYRDPKQNESVGGVKDSAHEKGLAVDLRCADSELQKKLCWALGVAGFQRIGVYDRHVHVDVDGEKPKPAYWTGESH